MGRIRARPAAAARRRRRGLRDRPRSTSCTASRSCCACSARSGRRARRRRRRPIRRRWRFCTRWCRSCTRAASCALGHRRRRRAGRHRRRSGRPPTATARSSCCAAPIPSTAGGRVGAAHVRLARGGAGSGRAPFELADEDGPWQRGARASVQRGCACGTRRRRAGCIAASARSPARCAPSTSGRWQGAQARSGSVRRRARGAPSTSCARRRPTSCSARWRASRPTRPCTSIAASSSRATCARPASSSLYAVRRAPQFDALPAGRARALHRAARSAGGATAGRSGIAATRWCSPTVGRAGRHPVVRAQRRSTCPTSGARCGPAPASATSTTCTCIPTSAAAQVAPAMLDFLARELRAPRRLSRVGAHRAHQHRLDARVREGGVRVGGRRRLCAHGAGVAADRAAARSGGARLSRPCVAVTRRRCSVQRRGVERGVEAAHARCLDVSARRASAAQPSAVAARAGDARRASPVRLRTSRPRPRSARAPSSATAGSASSSTTTAQARPRRAGVTGRGHRRTLGLPGAPASPTASRSARAPRSRPDHDRRGRPRRRQRGGHPRCPARRRRRRHPRAPESRRRLEGRRRRRPIAASGSASLTPAPARRSLLTAAGGMRCSRRTRRGNSFPSARKRGERSGWSSISHPRSAARWSSSSSRWPRGCTRRRAARPTSSRGTPPLAGAALATPASTVRDARFSRRRRRRRCISRAGRTRGRRWCISTSCAPIRRWWRRRARPGRASILHDHITLGQPANPTIRAGRCVAVGARLQARARGGAQRLRRSPHRGQPLRRRQRA